MTLGQGPGRSGLEGEARVNAKVAYAGQRLWYDRGRLLALVAVVVVLAVTAVVGVRVLTGNGGGQPRSAVAPPVATSTPTVDPVTAAISQAYKNATAAYVHAATTGNPNDPALAATAFGVEEVTETANLQNAAAHHIISRGNITIGQPRVESITPVPGTPNSTAQVTDCRLDNLNAYNAQTGQPVNARTGVAFPPGQTPGPPQAEQVAATLGQLDGVWKLLDEKLTVVVSCPAV